MFPIDNCGEGGGKSSWPLQITPRTTNHSLINNCEKLISFTPAVTIVYYIYYKYIKPGKLSKCECPQ